MADRKDPFLAFCFRVTIDKVSEASVGYFKSVGGLSYETEVVEHREGGENNTTKKLVGATKWKNITLKRGITDAMDMWQWRKLVEEGKLDEARKNGSVVMYTQAGAEIARWDFINAWPSKLTGPTANAQNNEVAIEELEITHEGYNRVK